MVQPQSVTIVTAFYDLDRENWTKTAGCPVDYNRSKSQYMQYFSILAQLENKIIVYTSQDNVELIKNIRAGRATEIIVYDPFLQFKDLHNRIHTVMNTDEYRSKIDPENKRWAKYHNVDYSLVTCLKSFFVSHSVDLNLVDTEAVAWVDFGYCRNPDEIIIKQWAVDLNLNKINVFGFGKPPGLSTMLLTNQVYSAGGVTVLGKQLANWLWNTEQEIIYKLINLSCISEDQRLRNVCISQHPDMFEFHYLPKQQWFGIIGNTNKTQEHDNTASIAHSPQMVELHIFTNCTTVIDHKKTIMETYQSYCATFKCEPKPIIWIDWNPNTEAFPRYLTWLKDQFPGAKFRKTRSLRHGYIQMIDTTRSEFVFVLEHDWIFNSEFITHTTEQVGELMRDHSIEHLRFCRHIDSAELISARTADYLATTDHGLYCLTQSASNNPHMVNVPLYKRSTRKYIKLVKGSEGIEQNLRNRSDCRFAIYGNKQLPPTSIHLDGRTI